MKTIALYSDVDNYIVISFVTMVAFMFLLSWLWNKLKEKALNYKLQNEPIEYDIKDYTLNFENTTENYVTVGFKSKVILFIISLIIIVAPLYEFLETLRPTETIFFHTCLGSGRFL